MFNYNAEQREKFFDYLTKTFNLSEKATVIRNQIIPFTKILPLGVLMSDLSIDIVTAIDNDNNTIFTTNGLSGIAGCELCIKVPADTVEDNKTKVIIEKIYDYCNQIAECFINENDGTILTVDFSDIIGVTAFAEITNELGVTIFCDGACEWLLSMCWIR